MRNQTPSKRPLRNWLAGVCGILLATALPLMAEKKFETLQVGLETFSNVRVTSLTDTDLFFTHSKGFANVKVADLDLAVQEELGFKVARPNESLQGSLSLQSLPFNPEMGEAQQKMLSELQGRWQTLGRNLLLAVLLVAVAIYLFVCYCFLLICVKAGSKPGPLIWVPLLQYLPLYKAAGMSPAWFLMQLLPLATPFLASPLLQVLGPDKLWILLLPQLAPVVAWLVWCVKISKARGLGLGMAFLLIFPLTSLFAFLYLAFGPSSVRPPSFGRTPDTESHKQQATDTSFFYQT